MSSADFDRLPYNNEFLIPSGYRYVAKLRVHASSTAYDFIGFVRSPDREPFDNAWIDCANGLFRNHLKRVAGLRHEIRSKPSQTLHELALDMMPQGAMIVDMAGRILYCNRAAEDAMARCLVLFVRNQRLTSSNEAVSGALKRILQRRSSGGAFRCPLMSGSDGALNVSIFSLPEAVDLDCMRGQRCMLILMHVSDMSHAGELLVERMQEMFSLTKGEARAAVAVSAGIDVKTAASRLGQSYETTRTVLKRVFAKVGIERQSQLTALIASIGVTLPYVDQDRE
jgi:DNA-binding CsgD family transcriptional regulator